MSEYLTHQELTAILTAARTHSARLHAIVLLAYTHALRVSEIASLTLTDVANGRVDVRRCKGSRRTVQPLQSSANSLFDEPSVLAKWLATRGDADGSQLLFTSRQGSGLKPRQIQNLFEDLTLRCGIDRDRRHIHILKHSVCSHLIRAGVSPAYVQAQAGHADINNTMRYSHVNQHEAAAETARALQSVFAA
jgi:type 1 fimbriae regulatory protein FimB